MSKQKVAPYGSWKSPITSDMAASATQLTEVLLHGDGIYWRELRPEQQGRFTIMKRTADEQIVEITQLPFNARTTVHEYGGGSYLVVDDTVYFSNFSDQRIYSLRDGVQPEPITPEVNMRYADGILDPLRNRMICVREDHSDAGHEAVNTLVAVDLSGKESGQVLVSGNDFYSSPRLNPDGSRLAWLTWNHPDMPWDSNELWVSEVKTDGSLAQMERVAGAPGESIVQPEWSPDGILHFVSDRTGWWNLYRRRGDAVEPLHEMAADFGRPHWTFRMSSYALESAKRIICAYTTQGKWRLAEIDTQSLDFEPIKTPYTEITYVQAGSGRAVFVGGSPTEPESIVQVDLQTRQPAVLHRSQSVLIDPGYLSIPQAIEFLTSQDLKAHALFYPPSNRDFSGPRGELPPLIVISHGGPTSAARTTLSLAMQFWTTRGFAVVDVNYGGSTGYGRDYWRRLYGHWGVVDVDDCANAALFLVKDGKADDNRLVIRGGSAGGYTTLCALTFRDVFKAGASYFGISDLEVFRKETHKFESRYDMKLIGPYPDRRDLYWQRSPIHFTDRISCPMILFQGLEDKIVPPTQAELMVKALHAKGLPYAYVAFEGEQHGFRRKENIKRSLEAELYFYSKIFRFQLADRVEPVKIENMKA